MAGGHPAASASACISVARHAKGLSLRLLVRMAA